MAKKESCLMILFKMVLLLTLLVAGVVAGVFYLKDRVNEYFNRGETIEVPDFRGKHLLEVFKKNPGDLIIETKDEKFDPRYPKDFVIAQIPDPGTRVKPNKKVLLTVSLGNKQVTVPDLAQKSLRESILALLNAQLAEGTRAYINSSKVPRDRVVSQTPLPSTPYGAAGTVNLLISMGSGFPKAPLPNVVGKSSPDVQNNLLAWGLKPGRIVSKRDPHHASQIIIGTRPSPYSPVAEGTTVDLLVSAGNEAGNAKANDLKLFELCAEAAPSPAVTKPADTTPPPRIIMPDDPLPEPVPPTPAPVAAAGRETTQISFSMPDGFMPKEVKFFLVMPEGRQQLYSGTHKPLELIKVDVPRTPRSRVQIYINDVPIEERQVP